MMTSQEVFSYIGIDMGWVLIGAVAACLLMFMLIIILFVKNHNLKKKYKSFMTGEDGKSLEKVMIEYLIGTICVSIYLVYTGINTLIKKK